MKEVMNHFKEGHFVGRIWIEENKGPSVFKVIDNKIFDITSKITPTLSSLLEMENPIQYLNDAEGKYIISMEELNSDIEKKLFNKQIRAVTPL